MALARLIQPSFGSGEISPEAQARTDILKYRSALKKCSNFFVKPTGGVINRPGTRLVTETKDSTKYSNIHGYIFSEDQAYILELGDEYVRFATSAGQINLITASVSSWSASTNYELGDYASYNNSTYYCILDNSYDDPPDISATYWVGQTIYERPTPYISSATKSQSEVFDLRFESSGDVIWVTHPDHQPRTLTRFGEVDWRLELYEPEDGPFMIENTDESITLSLSAVTGSGVTLSASSAIFDSGHVGSLWLVRHYIEEQKVTGNFTSTGTTSGIKCFTTWRVISHGTWTGTFSVEKSDDGGSTWTKLRTFTSVNDFNANTFGTEDVETNPIPFLVRINMSAYTSGTANIDLTTDPFYQEGILKVTAYTNSTTMTVDVLQDAGSVAGTSSWHEGSWSDYRGWPRVARFYKDRLIFAGTNTEPMTVWMTQTSNYYSFGRHTPLLDTDGITLNIPSRQVNIINGLIALQRLIILTSASEWSIGPGNTGVLSPSSIDTRNESYYGSSGVEPIVVGNESMYIQTSGKVLRNIGYELGSDSFTGARTNILAEHLSRRWTFTDLAYQQDPDSLIFVLRSDGKFVALTYLKEQEVVGWSQHNSGLFVDEDGNDVNQEDVFESIAVIPNSASNFDELFLVANRVNGRYIERLAQRMSIDPCTGEFTINQIHMDSTVTYGG
jgi:hypothetical protein